MIRRNSKLEQKFLPVLCFALPLSPASRLGKNSNLWKVFLPHLDVGLGSCLTWSNALFGAIFPMGLTFSLPKLSIEALIFDVRNLSGPNEWKCTWMFVLGLACSGLWAPSLALNLWQSILWRRSKKGFVNLSLVSLSPSALPWGCIIRISFPKNMIWNKLPACEFVVLPARWVWRPP